MINYSANQILVVNTGYTTKSLPSIISRGLRRQTLGSLSQLGCDPATVLDVGTTNANKSFIKLLTSNVAIPAYRGGNGITIYFDSDEQLNNSFELSKAFIKDKCVFKVYNTTGSTIVKNSLVYQNGFDTTQQLPTVALASAAAAGTSIVLGITADDIANGACGTVINQGSIILDTSSYSAEGDPVYLSDTPGTTSTTAGTIEVVVGRVLCVAVEGSISIFSGLTSGANTGGSGGGGGGSTPVPAEARTTDSLIATADFQKMLTNTGAAGAVTLTADSGLADGFEFTFVNTAGQDLTFSPDGTDNVAGPLGVGEAGRGVSHSASQSYISASYKLVGTTWILIAGQVNAFETVQLQARFLDGASGIDISGVTGSPGSTTFTFLLREEGGGMASLGSTDQTNTFSIGSDLGVVSKVYLEIINSDGSNAFVWGSPFSNAGGVTMFFGDGAPTGWNANTGGAIDLNITSPNTTGVSVPASTTNTYWLDTAGNIYFRNSGAGAVTDYATAVATGAL